MECRRRGISFVGEGPGKTTGAKRFPINRHNLYSFAFALKSFVEINAIGFRKILKKYDKRSTSTTKELYLARQVDVQPVFNREVCSSAHYQSCSLELTNDVAYLGVV